MDRAEVVLRTTNALVNSQVRPGADAWLRYFVPKTSVVRTTERTFVVRSQNGRAQWADLLKGVAEGNLQEMFGDLKPGDPIVRRATDAKTLR